ncbi:MAG: hypothetical protein ACTHOU_18030 [Aureliella sp.]
MKSSNLNPVDNYLAGSWEALGNGAPVLVALAQICSAAWTGRRVAGVTPAVTAAEPATPGNAGSLTGEAASQPDLFGSIDGLSGEALAILHAAGQRGIIELKAVNTAFDAAARLLAVYVEESDERTVAFRDAHRPEVTVRFLDGFRELCQRGFVIHHIYRDFSLSPIGFEVARTISREQVRRWLDMATEFGLHD